MYFYIEDALGVGDIDVETYTFAFVKRCYRFLQGGIFDFTDFDMQKTLDDTLADHSIFHDRAEHKVIGKGKFVDGFMVYSIAAPSVIEIVR